MVALYFESAGMAISGRVKLEVNAAELAIAVVLIKSRLLMVFLSDLKFSRIDQAASLPRCVGSSWVPRRANSFRELPYVSWNID